MTIIPIEGSPENNPLTGWRRKLNIIIFGTDSPSGKLFDIILLWVIILSVVVVMLESVRGIQEEHTEFLRIVEWIFTILFTIEYIARLISAIRPLRYAFSFLGLIDVLALLPTYLSLIVTGGHYLIVIRAIRLLRVFRIFKLVRYQKEARFLLRALTAARPKITVFLGTVLTIVVIMGTIMYLIEGDGDQFTSIPRSIYWAIVTLTTVGYGDIIPQTTLGQTVAAMIMILGYSIIAVPTGIVTAELAQIGAEDSAKKHCEKCKARGHLLDAEYCRKCGAKLTER